MMQQVSVNMQQVHELAADIAEAVGTLTLPSPVVAGALILVASAAVTHAVPRDQHATALVEEISRRLWEMHVARGLHQDAGEEADEDAEGQATEESDD